MGNASPDSGRRCDRCSADLMYRLFIPVEEALHCEGCILDRHRHPDVVSDPRSQLAESLVEALDLREHETGLHSRRVACHTLVLARRLTDDPAQLVQIYWGALLHDLGKIGVRDAVLLKHGELTPAEWDEMRQHPRNGYQILSRIPDMVEASRIVLCHEERFDGTGYPEGLLGEAIPLGARLFAPIDTLDAMTSDRPYRRGCSFDEAAREIIRCAGTQFDPAVIAAFEAESEALREMVELKCTMTDTASRRRNIPEATR